MIMIQMVPYMGMYFILKYSHMKASPITMPGIAWGMKASASSSRLPRKLVRITIQAITADLLAPAPAAKVLEILAQPVGKHLRFFARLSPSGSRRGFVPGGTAHRNLDQSAFDCAVVEHVPAHRTKPDVLEIAPPLGGEHECGPSVEGALQGVAE